MLKAQSEVPRSGIRRSGAFIISAVSSSHGLFHAFDQSLVVLLPEIKDAFSLSPVGVGLIAATERTADGLVSAPAGVATDMHRRHWGLVLAICMGLFGLGWLVVGSAPVFPLLLVGIAMVAVASSIWHLPATAALSQRFPLKRATVLSLHSVGGNIGDVIGPVMTTAIFLGFLTWRGVLGVYAIVPLPLVVVVFWAFRTIGEDGSEGPPVTLRGQIELTKALLRNRVLWAINLLAALRSVTFVSLVIFLPIYFHDDLGMSFRARGMHLALLMFAGILSTPLLGYLSDRLGRKPVLVPAALSLCALTLLLVPFGTGAPLTLIIALLGVFLFGDQPILTAAALDMVAGRVVNTTLGVLAATRVIPTAAAPVVAGALYQAFGIDALFYFVATVFALSAVIMARVPLTAGDV